MNRIKPDPVIFKPSNTKAFLSLVPIIILALLGSFLIMSEGLFYFWLGEVILSFFFLQTFILLHECGHLSFFKTRALNIYFGHLFGFLSFIPFYTWQQMHNLHHRWTGWRDKDPTTESTITPGKSIVKNAIVNIAWWLFIPVFFLSYKISNYWNLMKIKRFLKASQYKQAVTQVILYLVVYAVLAYFFYSFIWLYILPAFLLSLVWKELVIMTQHSHVEMPVSDEKNVKPILSLDQVQFTRSFYLNSFLSKYFLFNFNLHEAHHAYPRLPAYKLDQVNLDIPKDPRFFLWVRKAKSMKGVDYIFKTSKETGKVF